MRHALILPVPMLNTFGTSVPKVEGEPRLHLCLSHLFNHGFPMCDDYIAYYRKRREAGDYIIMDNGADESIIGHGQSLYETLQAAAQIRAQEIVLPDVQEDWKATRHSTLEALATLSSYAGRQAYNQFGRPRLMIVPQGRTWLEWEMCALELINATRELIEKIECPGFVIGVAKQYHGILATDKVPGRVRAVEWLRGRLKEFEDIHLLGYPRGYHDVPEIEEKFPGFVRSVDSAKPVVYAMNGMIVEKPGTLSMLPAYPRRPQAFFLQEMQMYERECLEANIFHFCHE